VDPDEPQHPAFRRRDLWTGDTEKTKSKHRSIWPQNPARDCYRLAKSPIGFVAQVTTTTSGLELSARKILLATGSTDIEPDLPGLKNAVREGIVRYCPICDGFEASGKRIAVIGHGAHSLGEAIFIARTYSSDVTLLSLGQPMHLNGEEEASARDTKSKSWPNL